MFLLGSCANEKTLTINGKQKTFEPYGWADSEKFKNDSVSYEVNVGNIFWSVILCETVFVPVWLTGWQFYEPDHVKPEYVKPPVNVRHAKDTSTIIYYSPNE